MCVAAALLLALVAAPAPTAPAAVAEPPAEMLKLDELIKAGTWRCEGTVVPSNSRQPTSVRLRMVMAAQMGGVWRQINTSAEGPGQNPELISQEWVTFEGKTQTFARLALDGLGHSSITTADNTDGTRLTFAGSVFYWEKKRDSRVVWEEHPQGLHITWDISGAHGDWVRTRALLCQPMGKQAASAAPARPVARRRPRRRAAAAGKTSESSPAAAVAPAAAAAEPAAAATDRAATQAPETPATATAGPQAPPDAHQLPAIPRPSPTPPPPPNGAQGPQGGPAHPANKP